jgi:preprotein translocase subunit SecG
METVALVILLLLAFALIGVVLLQRNEGAGLGLGGGGGAMAGRTQATGLQRATWLLGAGFMAMSLVLTVIAAQKAGEASVVDQIGVGVPAAESEPVSPGLGGDLLPPPVSDAPLVPGDDTPLVPSDN